MNIAIEKIKEVSPWESMLKRVGWKQLGDISGKRILDFGSGTGKTADYFAKDNSVVAIEPDESASKDRWMDYDYLQLTGSIGKLKEFPRESFDIIICHNVLEYIDDKESVIREFERLLKPNGYISIIKHNRPGRVMQMVTLLNNFEHARELLEGHNCVSSNFGTIRYYEDDDILKWSDNLIIQKTLGIRTFWDLQQKQECHSDPAWQDEMIKMDLLVSDIDIYRNISFFHHIFIKKQCN